MADQPPYSQLLPLVHLLESDGNVALDGGFLNSQGGWYCRLRDPINFDLLRQRLDLADSLDLAVGDDTVLDKSTWCAIVGPGAASNS